MRNDRRSAILFLENSRGIQCDAVTGYDDARTLSEDGGLPPENRQLFLKVSYAFQR